MNSLKPIFGDDFKYLIQERIKNFWGYGNLDGDVWFVGMEEGYSGESEFLINRFKTTSHGSVFDIYEDIKGDPEHKSWFEDDAPTQSTYRTLIYILLFLKTGKEPTLEKCREYQIKEFARKTSNHAALELMPLPSKSTKESDWLYADSKIEGLSSRKEYLDTYKPKRAEALYLLIQKHNPKLVIFYSRGYIKDWQDVAVISFKEIIPKQLEIAKDDTTVYAVIPHPTSFGVSKDNLKNITEAIISSLA